MRVSEILRQLAELVDQTEDAAVADAGMDQSAGADVTEPGMDGAETGCGDITVTQLEPVEVDGTDGTEAETMVSPLQQEHELLKKSQGVDNHVDEFAEDELDTAEKDWEGEMKSDSMEVPEPELEEDDELEAMKRLAGVHENNGPHNYAEDIKPVSMNPRANAALEASGNTYWTSKDGSPTKRS